MGRERRPPQFLDPAFFVTRTGSSLGHIPSDQSV